MVKLIKLIIYLYNIAYSIQITMNYPPPPPPYPLEAIQHSIDAIKNVGKFEKEYIERKEENKKIRVAKIRAEFAADRKAFYAKYAINGILGMIVSTEPSTFLSGRKRTTSPPASSSRARRKLDGEPDSSTIVEDVKPFEEFGLSAEYGKIFIKMGKGYSHSLEEKLLDEDFDLDSTPSVKTLVKKLRKRSSSLAASEADRKAAAHAFLKTYLSPDAWKILETIL
jgi:hypothetical protein